jgi:hypothetical protein
MIALEDLKGMTEEQVKRHIANKYTGKQYETTTQNQIDQIEKYLQDYNILFAYKSVGSYRCDSSSYFLLENKYTKELVENFGGHCSCYGFEDQWEPEPVTLEQLNDRITKADLFYTGGYDDNKTINQEIGKKFILDLYKESTKYDARYQ